MESIKIPRALAIFLPISLVCIIFGLFILLLSYELVVLSNKWTILQPKLTLLISEIQSQLESTFNWSNEAQFKWFHQTLDNFGQNFGGILQSTLKSSSSVLVNLIIIPIYIFLLLNYRKKFVSFLSGFFPDVDQDKVKMAISETIIMFSNFVKGMIIVYLCVGVLNSVGLWLLGVDNPLFYGVLTAIMTIIPYIGIIISALLPITLSWITTGSIVQPIGIIAVFTAVQYLEANLIFPYVVGRQINLNTLISIITIFLGGILWGITGMILFLPMVAIFRIFFSHFEEMKGWSGFLGNGK